jgi:hypothetical protein
METVSRERTERLEKLTVTAEALAKKEQQLQDSINAVSKQDIADLLRRQNKSGRLSNWLFFALGVLTQTVITLILHFVYHIG